MKEPIKQLTNIGLTQKQAEFYYHALELGSFSLLAISKKSKIKRPTCYVIVQQLVDMGLVSRVPAGRKSQYRVEPLSGLLDQKRNELAELENVTKNLEDKLPQPPAESAVTMYTGRTGIRKVWNEMLNCQSGHIYYTGAEDHIIEALGEVFYKNWIKERVKKNIWLHEIEAFEREVNKDINAEALAQLRELLFVPSRINIKNAIFVYDDKVLLFTKGTEYFSVLIQNKALAETAMTLYRGLEKIALNPDQLADVRDFRALFQPYYEA